MWRLGAVAVIALSASPLALANSSDTLMDLLLAASGGDLHSLGAMSVWGDGAQLGMSGFQILDLLGASAGGARTTDVVLPSKGFAAGDADLNDQLQWPYCNAVGVYAYYFGGGSGRAITHAASVPVEGAPLCGGAFGPTSFWTDVSFDLSNLQGPPSCAIGQVLAPRQVAIGPFGGFSCGWKAACASGEGILGSVQYWSLSIDFFMGRRATAQMGFPGEPAPACA